MSVRVEGQVQQTEHTQEIVSLLLIPACLQEHVASANLILPHHGILCLTMESLP